MKLVPKPEGFELRDKRAEKADDGSKWLSEDALYDASVDMQKRIPSGATLIAWYYIAENGEQRMAFRAQYQTLNDLRALEASIFRSGIES